MPSVADARRIIIAGASRIQCRSRCRWVRAVWSVHDLRRHHPVTTSGGTAVKSDSTHAGILESFLQDTRWPPDVSLMVNRTHPHGLDPADLDFFFAHVISAFGEARQ
jgi:hypothetical protein